jgi:hypothetical protein
MVLYNKANDAEYIRYDISIDDSSSKLLLSSKDIQKHIKHYTFNKDYDYKSFFSDMFIKLQEIHKHQHKRQSTTSTSTTVTFNLSEFIKDSKNSVYKLYLERRLNKKELWLISSPSHITKGSECYWKVEFFSLDKVAISNAAYFINKSINLDYMDFTHVIGVDPHDVSELLSTSDTIKINYPRMITYDLLSFIEFEFDKLVNTTAEDLLTFIIDVKECNIDSKNLISRLNAAGNKKLVNIVLDRV